MIIAHRIAYSVARDTAVVNIVEGPAHILTLRLDVMAATQCRYIAFIHFASHQACETEGERKHQSHWQIGVNRQTSDGPQGHSDPIDRRCA